jgi:hypothetical protein
MLKYLKFQPTYKYDVCLFDIGDGALVDFANSGFQPKSRVTIS